MDLGCQNGRPTEAKTNISQYTCCKIMSFLGVVKYEENWWQTNSKKLPSSATLAPSGQIFEIWECFPKSNFCSTNVDWPKHGPPNQTNLENTSAETSTTKRDQPSRGQGVGGLGGSEFQKERKFGGSKKGSERRKFKGSEERRALYTQTWWVCGLNCSAQAQWEHIWRDKQLRRIWEYMKKYLRPVPVRWHDSAQNPH